MPPEPPAPKGGLFRRSDWIGFALASLLTFAGYVWTMAPDVTLEDSGELAVASMYLGVPHPPGYPVWTIYSWLFTVLLPFSNIAWRVSVSSAFAAALSCGLIALMISRVSATLLDTLEATKGLAEKLRDRIGVVAGFSGALLLGFNGFMWSQAVIVEVYTLSVLSLTAMLVMLLHWVYFPQQRKYLYWAAFLFGICFTNHQTLIVAAMGIQVLVAAAQPRLGREAFLANGVVFLAGLGLMAAGGLENIASSPALRGIFILVGVASIAAYVWLAAKTQQKFMEIVRTLAVYAALGFLASLIPAAAGFLPIRGGMWLPYLTVGGGAVACAWMLIRRTWTLDRSWLTALVSLAAFLGGVSFYLFMPFASITNPPMNWGYASTWDGFVHAFTRGQYEKTNPSLEIGRLFDQVLLLFEGAVEEFNIAFLLVALVPVLFYPQMRRNPRPAEQGVGPERAWLLGLLGIYACLAFLLLWLLNPSTDRQSRELTRVFFTASHVLIAIGFGYGLAIIAGLCAQRFAEFRRFGLIGATGAAAIALFVVLVTFGWVPLFAPDEPSYFFGIGPSRDPLVRGTALLALGLAGIAVLYFVLPQGRHSMTLLLALFAVLPLKSILSHWADNEQRGHLFGYWFGHDMFHPPYKDKDGQPLLPEMTRDAILFGGTDPGRFNPTYMIFCESFIPPRAKPRNPDFDRRDVYLITQNALADGTYLNYIRAHYNRSAQVDPPFFQEMLRPRKEKEQGLYTNWVARAVAPVDRAMRRFGDAVEARRRALPLYPLKEIHIPTPLDSMQSYDEYMQDAWRRKQMGQLRPGEDVNESGGRVSVSGQVAVMAINALLAKVIFDKNPGHEFFIEESFPLDWMFPHLTPFGIIMKINREPLDTMPEDAMARDHEFWSQYSDRLIGNWITYDTPVREITDFVERVFIDRDLRGFQGDRKFLRDDNAQKAFSKLRSAIAGVYVWRLQNAARTPAEQQRLAKEAEFAFKQAFAYCPYSPEAVFRFANLLVTLGRFDDAMLVARTCMRLDPFNPAIASLVAQIGEMQKQRPEIERARADLQAREERFRADPADADNALALVQSYLQMQMPGNATNVLATMAAALEPRLQTNPADARTAAYLAAAYVQLRQPGPAARALDTILSQTNVDTTLLLSVAQSYAQLGDAVKLEQVLRQITQRMPDSPEGWYDYAAVAASIGKVAEARSALETALRLSDARRLRDPRAKDLRATAASDPRLAPIPGARP
ncbi:MAG: protein O-mannosyl-transferase family [Limisphaerales bacterium]